MSTLLVAAAAVLAGAVVRGYSGFGASMFWVASLSLLYPPTTVVPTVLGLEVLASLALLPAVRRQADWGSMRWLLLASVLATPPGVLLLRVVPEEPMRVTVLLAVLAGTLALACGVRTSQRPSRRASLAAGAVCGAVNGATAIGGPPAVLLYFSGGTDHETGRATLIAYFLAMDGVGLAMMAAAGLVSVDVVLHVAACAPVALVGIAAGEQVFRRTGGRNFRSAVLAILGVLCLAVLTRSLVSW